MAFGSASSSASKRFATTVGSAFTFRRSDASNGDDKFDDAYDGLDGLVCPGGLQVPSVVSGGSVVMLIWFVFGMFFGVVRLDFFMGEPQGWVLPSALVIMLSAATGYIMRRIVELNIQRRNLECAKRDALAASGTQEMVVLDAPQSQVYTAETELRSQEHDLERYSQQLKQRETAFQEAVERSKAAEDRIERDLQACMEKQEEAKALHAEYLKLKMDMEQTKALCELPTIDNTRPVEREPTMERRYESSKIDEAPINEDAAVSVCLGDHRSGSGILDGHRSSGIDEPPKNKDSKAPFYWEGRGPYPEFPEGQGGHEKEHIPKVPFESREKVVESAPAPSPRDDTTQPDKIAASLETQVDEGAPVSPARRDTPEQKQLTALLKPQVEPLMLVPSPGESIIEHEALAAVLKSQVGGSVPVLPPKEDTAESEKLNAVLKARLEHVEMELTKAQARLAEVREGVADLRAELKLQSAPAHRQVGVSPKDRQRTFEAMKCLAEEGHEMLEAARSELQASRRERAVAAAKLKMERLRSQLLSEAFEQTKESMLKNEDGGVAVALLRGPLSQFVGASHCKSERARLLMEDLA